MIPEFTLHHLLLNSVEKDPHRTAVTDGGASHSYEHLALHAARLACALQRNGLRRGDRVGICLEKSWEAVVAIHGVAQAGGVFVNIHPQLKEAQVQHIVNDCDVRMFIADGGKLGSFALPSMRCVFHHGAARSDGTHEEMVPLADVLGNGPAALEGTPAIENDLATIIYTSGSTGRPKGIMISHRNLVAGAQIVSTYLKNTSSDRVLSILPFSFDYGLNQLTTMVRVGGTLVLQRSLLSGEILKSLRQEAITGVAGVPSVWPLILQNHRSLRQEPLTHLRYITNSGGMVSARNLAQLREMLPGTSIYLMYGLTEAFRSTYLPPEEIDRGPTCIGRAIPNTDVWVVNEKGERCAPGETGELVHRGPTVALGYWGDEERTRAVYRPNPSAPPELRNVDTIVYSGDLVKADEDGFFHFISRRDELIKTSGFRVSPQEIEELLYGVPEVREAAAFGQGDFALGQTIVGIVSLHKEGAITPDEIREHCRRRAPHHLAPHIIHILPDLPKTPTGKIDRAKLKHDYTHD